MRLYQHPHPYYCGVDLHARTMHVCVVDDGGLTREHVSHGDCKVTAAEPSIDVWCVAPARVPLTGPGVMTPFVEPHRSATQPERSQNSVNEMGGETFS